MTVRHKESVFGPLRREAEILESLRENPELYYQYKSMENKAWQQQLLQFLAGTKTLPVTYDPFFKKLFHPDIHPDRLERFLSCLLGKKVKLHGILPTEDTLLEGERLIVMDILVELEGGALVLVEIQKIPYSFPAERVSCYSADLLLRQYNRVKGERGKGFSYRDLKKVYTIVIYEKSAGIFHNHREYLHYGTTRFDSGLELELLQEFCMAALDVFKENSYHKEEGERAGWLSLLVTETVKEAVQNIVRFPWLEEIYREMAEYRRRPGEAMKMFSEALRQMDRNTVQYMIEEQQKEIEGLKKETEGQKKEIEEQKKEIEGLRRQKDNELAQKDDEIIRLRKLLEEKGQ